MRPPIDPNPFATLYASPRDNAAGSCGYRGAMARGERAEIAHARANERPAHLPGFLERWEEGWSCPECGEDLPTAEEWCDCGWTGPVSQ